MPGFVTLLAMAFLFSCEDREFQEATREQTLESFRQVELNSVFEVHLIQDSVYSLKIVGDETIIGNVDFSIEAGVLKVTNSTGFKWMNPENNKVKLYIRSNRLEAVMPNETCDIKTVNPIISDEFRIVMGHDPKLAEIDIELDNAYFSYWNNHQCGGKLTLRGNTSVFEAYTFGYMAVDAVGLHAKQAIIENNSKGDFEVRVSNRIECWIRGVGNIYLYGNPPELLLHEQSSEGKLISVD